MSSGKSINIKIVNQQTLFSFLQNFRIKDQDKVITHTSWGTVMGKYHVPDEKMDKFYKLYSKEILSGNKLNLIEQHTEVGPVIIDIDFKYDKSIRKRQHTVEHVKKLVELYIKEINETFVIPDKATDLIAFVFERDQPYQYKGNTKDGIHIVFPFIVSEPNVQYLIRDNILKALNADNIFEDINYKNNGLNDIVDRSVIHKNGWFMYGSSKPYCGAYKLTTIYDQYLEKIAPDEVNYKGINNLAKFLSIRRHTEEDCFKIRIAKMDDINKMETKQANYKLNKLKHLQTDYYDIKQISKLLGILDDKRNN